MNNPNYTISYFLRRSRLGFSLIEIILAISIIAIGVPAIGHLFAVAFKEESDTSHHTQAAFLASALMDEISARRFRESALLPGNSPEVSELNGLVRTSFNDIDDYGIFSQDAHGITQWGALNPPRDEAGNSLTTYSKFSQLVRVTNISPPTTGPTARTDYSTQADGSTDFKLVKVVISWDSAKRNVTLYKVFALHQ